MLSGITVDVESYGKHVGEAWSHHLNVEGVGKAVQVEHRGWRLRDCRRARGPHGEAASNSTCDIVHFTVKSHNSWRERENKSTGFFFSR